MSSFTDAQYQTLLNNNALLSSQLAIARENLEISRNDYVTDFVIWSKAQARIEEYKAALALMNFAGIQSAPLDGTEIMCLTANGVLKKAKWLTTLTVPCWGDVCDQPSIAATWTFPPEDPPLFWLPLVPTSIWQSMTNAPTDGTEIIVTVPNSNKFVIVNWCVNTNGVYGFWSRFEVNAGYLPVNPYTNYVWLKVPTVLTS